MRRRNVAISLAVVGVVAFAFFVPIAYVPPHTPCYHGCSPEGQYGSLTYVLLGHGGYYTYGHYSIW